MAKGGRVADRLLGDDVDGATDGRGTEEGRASTTDHLHTVDHIGRNLLQAIDTREGGEDGTGIDQDLGVVAVQAIDAHLRETAVLTVVLGAHARLEVEALRQAGGLSDVEDLAAYHTDQVGGQSAGRLIAIGRDHHLVDGDIVGGQGEIDFLGGIVLDGDGTFLGLIA